MAFLAPIVEGHGEVEAVPILLQRIARACQASGVLRVNPPIRVKAGSFLNDDDFFRRYVTLAAAKAAQESGSVLILLDCEDHCPAILGPALLARAKQVRNDVGMFVCLAYREFETWFIAAAGSLRGIHGMPDDLAPPQGTERIRDAKGWLSARMDLPYDPVTHQAEFSRRIEIAQARSNASFNRLYIHLANLMTQQPQGRMPRALPGTHPGRDDAS